MTDTLPILEAARRIILAGPEEYRRALLHDLQKARFVPMNEDGTILEATYVDYVRPDQAENQFGPVGTVLDADGYEIDILVYWDRNRRLAEIELMKKGENDTVQPIWDTMKVDGQ